MTRAAPFSHKTQELEMACFVLLTNKSSGKRFFVNMDLIIEITQGDDSSILYTRRVSKGECYVVKESAGDIAVMARIEDSRKR